MVIDAILVQRRLLMDPVFLDQRPAIQELFLKFAKQLPVVLKDFADQRISYKAYLKSLVMLFKYAANDGYAADFCDSIGEERNSLNKLKEGFALTAARFQTELEQNSSRLDLNEVTDKELLAEELLLKEGNPAAKKIKKIYDKNGTMGELVETAPMFFIPVLTKTRVIPYNAPEALSS